MLRTLVILLSGAFSTVAGAAGLSSAMVIQDQAALRAAPRDSAQQQAMLWQGEVLEVRGERMDYLQVWDHKRERGGFIRAAQVRRSDLAASDANDLLGVARFVRDTPGAEAMGIGTVAAFLKAAPADVLNGEQGIEALDALGGFADRLARRASSATPQSKVAAATLAAHLDVAKGYGIHFNTYERDGRMQICYDGEAFRQVLSMKSNPEQRARAALGLTNDQCVDPVLSVTDRHRFNEWRAEILDRANASKLPAYLKNRVLMQRASVWASLAFQRTRKGEAADFAGNRAVAELASIGKTELPDDDLPLFDDAIMRTSASRWAAAPKLVVSNGNKKQPLIVTAAGEPGETCVALVAPVQDKNSEAKPLAKRCTYGVVWANSVTANRESTALTVAVQHTESWRELWVFSKNDQTWSISILPPAALSPDIGYAEFAGWVPGGKQMLVVREARAEGKYKRSFELVNLDTLATVRQASDPTILGAFQRWQDPMWKRETLSMR